MRAHQLVYGNRKRDIWTYVHKVLEEGISSHFPYPYRSIVLLSLFAFCYSALFYHNTTTKNNKIPSNILCVLCANILVFIHFTSYNPSFFFLNRISTMFIFLHSINSFFHMEFTMYWKFFFILSSNYFRFSTNTQILKFHLKYILFPITILTFIHT